MIWCGPQFEDDSELFVSADGRLHLPNLDRAFSEPTSEFSPKWQLPFMWSICEWHVWVVPDPYLSTAPLRPSAFRHHTRRVPKNSANN